MEPLAWHWVSFLRPPRVICLCPSEDESPIDCPHAFAFEHRQMCDKLRSLRARHVLCANDGSIVPQIVKTSLLLSLLICVLVHSTSQQAWKVMTSLSFKMNSLIGSNATSPFHQPEVTGWEGEADLAHEKTFMQKGKLPTNLPEFPTSLQRSHMTMVSEFRKEPIMSTTQFFKIASSISTFPGHCTHCELCNPGTGSGCCPSFQVSFQQSSNKTGMMCTPLLLATARNEKMSLMYWSLFLMQGAMCRKTLILLKPRSEAHRNYLPMASRSSFYHIQIQLSAQAGMQFTPALQVQRLYQSNACFYVHLPWHTVAVNRSIKKAVRSLCMVDII